MISWAFSLFEKGDITNGDETSLRQKCDKNGKTAKKMSCHECFSFMDKFFLIMPQAGRTDCHLDANFLRLRTWLRSNVSGVDGEEAKLKH